MRAVREELSMTYNDDSITDMTILVAKRRSRLFYIVRFRRVNVVTRIREHLNRTNFPEMKMLCLVFSTAMPLLEITPKRRNLPRHLQDIFLIRFRSCWSRRGAKILYFDSNIPAAAVGWSRRRVMRRHPRTQSTAVRLELIHPVHLCRYKLYSSRFHLFR